MAVARPHHNSMKKSALSLHAHLGGRRTDLSRIHGRTRPGGRVLLRLSETRPSCLVGTTTTDGKCPTFSEVASFSSSLKFYVFMDSVRFLVSPCGVQADKIIPKIQPFFLDDLAGLPFPPYSLQSDVALWIDSRRPGMISAPIFAAAKVRRPASFSDAPVQKISF